MIMGCRKNDNYYSLAMSRLKLVEKHKAENKRLKKALESISGWMHIASIEEGARIEDLQIRLSKYADKIDQTLKDKDE